MPSNVLVWMFVNFVSSVLIIWANKIVFNEGFKFTIILTIIHFIFTSIWFAKKKRTVLPIREVLRLSIAFCGFVAFNNLSLRHNSVGIYQLMKVLTTPCIVTLQFLVYHIRLTRKQLLSLLVICIGVVIATVNTVESNMEGILFGLAGVISTSIYQIWVKTEQKRLNCSSEDLLRYQAPLSVVLLILSLPLVEDISGFIQIKWLNCQVLGWIILSSILAVVVNISIFHVISRSSPVAYNVLGHGKLCFVLLSGFFVFGESLNMKSGMGILMAVSGIVLYTY